MALLAASVLAGCESYTPASPEAIIAARYESPEPPSVTLLSMVNEASGRSEHAGLLISGSQRVLYDPAGTFSHPDLPRAGDVHYGMTPRYVDYYQRYHARFGYFVESDRVPVPLDVADRLIANAEAEGQQMKMMCSLAAADVLRPVAPFEGVTRSIFPEGLRRDFETMPGVTTTYVHEDDIGQNKVWEHSDQPRS